MANDQSPHILVVGAGGLGSVFGGLLAENGLAVTLLGRSHEHVDAIKAAGGLKMVGFGGDRLIKLKATAEPSSIRSADIIIFLCKAGANRAAATSVKHVFGPASVAISFQNGLGNEDTLEDVLGCGRVIAGLTAQAARLENPGVARNFTKLPTYIGEKNGGVSDRVEWLAKLFSTHGLPTEPSAAIMRDKWQKLFANIAFSASSGLTGLSIGSVGANPHLHQVGLRAIEEASKVAAAEGYVFDENARRLIFDQLLASQGASANTSSMFRDLQAHKPSEVDFIYGSVIARGRKHSIDLPTLETLFALVHGAEEFWRAQ